MKKKIKQQKIKIISAIALLIGGALGGAMYNEISTVTATNKPDLFQLMLPIIIIDIIIIGVGLYTIKKI